MLKRLGRCRFETAWPNRHPISSPRKISGWLFQALGMSGWICRVKTSTRCDVTRSEAQKHQHKQKQNRRGLQGREVERGRGPDRLLSDLRLKEEGLGSGNSFLDHNEETDRSLPWVACQDECTPLSLDKGHRNDPFHAGLKVGVAPGGFQNERNLQILTTGGLRRWKSQFVGALFEIV